MLHEQKKKEKKEKRHLQQRKKALIAYVWTDYEDLLALEGQLAAVYTSGTSTAVITL